MEKLNLRELKLNDYPVQTYDKIRYRDTDRQGHVNNSIFSTFIETGRNEFLYDPNHKLCIDSTYVIARLELDFIEEIKWPGTIHIGTAVSRIGNSSLVLLQGLFQGDKLVGTAESVIVQVDDIHKKSKPLTEAQKAFLSQYTIKS